jgi:hypothetical protein
MSDISDVLTVLANIAECVVYPNGKNSPSITNSDIVIYPGWPSSDNLDNDLATGKTHVSIFPKAEERNTTRYREAFRVTKAPAPTLSLTIALQSGGRFELEGGGFLNLESGGSLLLEGNQASVTVGGTPSIPQNVMLRVNGRDYVYAVQSSDTLPTIAAALAALLAVDVAGTSASGTTINVGPLGRVQAARVGGFGTVTKEIRRQEHVVMLTVWAATPALRDTIAAAIDADLAERRFLTMPDGYGARLIYKNTLVVDALQKATLYRRDLNYMVEFATTTSKQAAAVIAPKIAFGAGTHQLDITI